VRVDAPHLSASLEGDLDQGARLTARSEAVGALSGLDGLPFSGAQAEGVLRREGTDYAFTGEAVAQGVRLGGYSGQAQGPVAFRLTRARVEAQGALRFAGGGGLIGDARPQSVRFDASYDRQEARLQLREARLEGEGFSAAAQGDGDAFSGRVAVGDLGLIAADLSGETAAQWRRRVSGAERQQMSRFFSHEDLSDRDFTWRFIELALSSGARLCVIPLQDFLGLGAEARMNTPATSEGNWAWRADPAQLTMELAAGVRRRLTESKRTESKGAVS
jgi:hypothetical protein